MALLLSGETAIARTSAAPSPAGKQEEEQRVSCDGPAAARI